MLHISAKYVLLPILSLGISLVQSAYSPIIDGTRNCIIIENIQGQNAAWHQEDDLKTLGFEITYVPGLHDPASIDASAKNLGGTDYAVWNPTARELITHDEYVSNRWYTLPKDDPHRAPMRYSAIEFVVSPLCSRDDISGLLTRVNIQTGWHELLQKQDNYIPTPATAISTPTPVVTPSPTPFATSLATPGAQGILPSENKEIPEEPSAASPSPNYGIIGLGTAAVVAAGAIAFAIRRKRHQSTGTQDNENNSPDTA